MPAHSTHLTARQRACSHPAGSIRPTLDERYEQCALCGLLRLAPIAAPWILEYDSSAEPAPAPELFPDREAREYIAESNAATRRRPRRTARDTKRPPTRTSVEEPATVYALTFESRRDYELARTLFESHIRDEALLGGSPYEQDSWLWWPPEPDADGEEAPARALRPYSVTPSACGASDKPDPQTAATLAMLDERHRQRTAAHAAAS